MSEEKIGLTIGADASEFTSQLKKVGRELDKVDDLLGKAAKNEGFDGKEARQYAQAVGRVRRQIKGLQGEYKQVNREIKRMEDAIAKGGEAATEAQKKQLEALKANKRAVAFTIQGAQSGLQGLMSRRAAGPITLRTLDRGSEAPKGGGMTNRLSRTAGIINKALALLAEGERTLFDNQQARARSYAISGGQASWRTEAFGRRIGYTSAQTQGVFGDVARATGFRDQGSTRRLMALERGRGVDVSTSLGVMQAARMASTFGGGVGSVGAISKGIERSMTNLPAEFASTLGGVLNDFTRSQQTISAQQMSGMMVMLTRHMGGVFSQSPSHVGRAIGGMSSAIRGAGGGEAGQAFALRAMGLGKGTSYFQALKRMQRGATPENVKRLLTQIHKEIPGGVDAKALALMRLSGGQLSAEASERLVNLNPSQLGSSAIRRVMAGRGRNDERHARRVANKMPLQLRTIARGEELARVRQKYDPAFEKFVSLQMKGFQIFGKGADVISYAAKELSGAAKSFSTYLSALKKIIVGGPGSGFGGAPGR